VLKELLSVLWLHRRLHLDPGAVSLAQLDPQTNAIFSCLADLWGPAFWLSEDLTGLVVLTLVRLSLRHGNTAASSIGYASYGVFQALVLKRERLGQRVCQLGVQVAEKAGDPLYLGRARFMYEAFFGHLDQPLRNCVNTFRELVSACLRAGDYPYAGASANMFLYYLPVTGAPLSDFLTEARNILEVARQTDQSRTILTVEILRRWTAILEGRSEYAPAVFSADLSGADARNKENERGLYHLFEISLLYLREDYPAALPHIEALPGNKMVNAYFRIYYAFFSALIYARLGERPGVDRTWWPRFQKFRRLVARSTARCPQNCRHMRLLLDAIAAARRTDGRRARKLFEAAIEDAREQGFQQNAAIAAGVAGRTSAAAGRVGVPRRRTGARPGSGITSGVAW
jgi:hypothetical protein